MGIDVETARFLLGCRKRGVSYERCATLGRQYYFPVKKETLALLREFGVSAGDDQALFGTSYPQYSEGFWKTLGARELQTIDASDYEGATLVHDMNQPISGSLKEQFSTLFDGGSLEHIFNFPVAIRNCLEMVRVGGHFLAQVPANNYFGHGFYQFSPELFFRVLSERNGFELQHMFAIAYGPRRRWFEVSDPEQIRARVTVINSFPVILLIQAKKTSSTPILRETPQQSDFASEWMRYSGKEKKSLLKPFGNDRLLRLKRGLMETIPSLARVLETIKFSSVSRTLSFRNRQSFVPYPKRRWGK